jgi:hypothetical protein
MEGNSAILLLACGQKKLRSAAISTFSRRRGSFIEHPGFVRENGPGTFGRADSSIEVVTRTYLLMLIAYTTLVRGVVEVSSPLTYSSVLLGPSVRMNTHLQSVDVTRILKTT